MLAHHGGNELANNKYAAAEQRVKINKGLIEADERMANFSALQQQIDVCKTSLDFNLNATKARAHSNYSNLVLQQHVKAAPNA